MKKKKGEMNTDPCTCKSCKKQKARPRVSMVTIPKGYKWGGAEKIGEQQIMITFIKC